MKFRRKIPNSIQNYQMSTTTCPDNVDQASSSYHIEAILVCQDSTRSLFDKLVRNQGSGVR